MASFFENLRGAVDNIGKAGSKFVDNFRNAYDEYVKQNTNTRPDMDRTETAKSVKRKLQEGEHSAAQGTLFLKKLPDIKVMNVDPDASSAADIGIAENADALNGILDKLEGTTSLTERKKIIDDGRKKIKGNSSGLDTWFRIAENGAHHISHVPNPWYRDDAVYDSEGDRTGLKREAPPVLDDFTDSMRILRNLTKVSKDRHYQQS